MGAVVMLTNKWLLGVAVVALAVISTVFGVSRATTSNDHALPPFEVPADGTAPVSHATQIIDGAKWAVATYTNQLGQHCLNDLPPIGSPADDQGGLNCVAPGELFRNTPVAWAIGARQQPGQPLTWAQVWVYGEASSNVSRIEIITTSCNSVGVPIDKSGVFLRVFARGALSSGSWPYRLVAFDGAGTQIFVKHIPLDPPPTPAATAAGVRAPTPDPDCAAG